MRNSLRRSLSISVGAVALAAAGAVATAQPANIGSTIVVVRTVTGKLETVVRQLVLHDGVQQNELISTGPDAASEIEFVDGTKLRLGARAQVVLDKFVYNPDPAKGAFLVTVTSGVFRFTTGNMDHQSYSITTPSGTLGVRGTRFTCLVDPNDTTCHVEDGTIVYVSAGGTGVYNAGETFGGNNNGLNGQTANMDNDIDNNGGGGGDNGGNNNNSGNNNNGNDVR